MLYSNYNSTALRCTVASVSVDTAMLSDVRVLIKGILFTKFLSVVLTKRLLFVPILLYAIDTERGTFHFCERSELLISPPTTDSGDIL